MTSVTVRRVGFLTRVGAVVAVLLAQGACGIPVLVGVFWSTWEGRFGPPKHIMALWLACSIVPTGALGLVVMRVVLSKRIPGVARISAVVVASATICGFWLAASNPAVPVLPWGLAVAFACGFVATWWQWRFAAALVALVVPRRAARDIGHGGPVGIVHDVSEPHERSEPDRPERAD
jgi:hypothetical protein